MKNDLFAVIHQQLHCRHDSRHFFAFLGFLPAL
jgi:hypothetical protein